MVLSLRFGIYPVEGAFFSTTAPFSTSNSLSTDRWQQASSSQ